jgi:hypothetical protein
VIAIKADIARFGDIAIQRIRDPTQERAVSGSRSQKGTTGTGVMLKTTYAIAAAAVIAAGFVTFPSLSPQVEARAVVQGAKTDRADTRPLANACSERGWPYFEAACLRDTRNPYGEARAVRFASPDYLRVAQGRPAH